MGMFDRIYWERPLPLLGGTSHVFGRGHEFQTKDLDCDLDEYLVTPEGTLIKGFRDWDRGAECCTPVDFDSDAADRPNFTGEIEFYGELLRGKGRFDTKQDGWAQWNAVFERGKLTAVRLTQPQNWIVPEGFPPVPREELMERALKLFAWGCDPKAGAMHYGELQAIATEVLNGDTTTLERFEARRG